MAEVNNLLHTYAEKWMSDFNINFPFVKNDEQLYKKLKYLEKVESNFYKHMTGNPKINTYGQFMAFLRDGYLSENDNKVLQRFQNHLLKNYLRQLESSEMHKGLYSMTIDLSITPKSKEEEKKVNQQISKTINSLTKSGFSVENNNGLLKIINFSLSTKNLKKIMNKVYKSGLKTSGSSTSKLIEQLNNHASDIVLFDSGLQVDSLTEVFKVNVASFPWGYKMKDLKQAQEEQDNSFLKEGVKKALETVRKFIINTLGQGASIEMKTALERTWKELIGPQEASFLNFSFFSQGGNFVNGVIGALGEFQTATIINYLLIKNNIPITQARIVANEFGRTQNQKGKTDVQIKNDINKWGIQVKNYNIFNTKETIGTNIHPFELQQAFYFSKANLNVAEFYTFVTNYVFNETYQETNGENDLEMFRLFMKQELANLMSFTTSKEIKDTVEFYMIGGNSLVPASFIIRAIWQTEKEAKQDSLYTPINIKSSFQGMTDEEWHDKTEAREENGNLIAFKPYKTYWEKDPEKPWGQADSWKPTPENRNLYGRLISNGITIETNFYYKKILEKVNANIYKEIYTNMAQVK